METFSFWANHNETPKETEIEMTSSYFKAIFPDIEEKYGQNTPINVEFKVIQAENFGV